MTTATLNTASNAQFSNAAAARARASFSFSDFVDTISKSLEMAREAGQTGYVSQAQMARVRAIADTL